MTFHPSLPSKWLGDVHQSNLDTWSQRRDLPFPVIRYDVPADELGIWWDRLKSGPSLRQRRFCPRPFLHYRFQRTNDKNDTNEYRLEWWMVNQHGRSNESCLVAIVHIPPIKHGLFFLRQHQTSQTILIPSPRPCTGSNNYPGLPCSVKSTPHSDKVGVLEPPIPPPAVTSCSPLASSSFIVVKRYSQNWLALKFSSTPRRYSW